MKIVLRIATLLLFVSGIVFFVGYQSGYFFSNKESPEGALHRPMKEKSTLEVDIPEDSVNVWLGDDSTELREVSNVFREIAPEEEAVELTEDQIRMFSSKSIVIETREPHYQITPHPSIQNLFSYGSKILNNQIQEPSPNSPETVPGLPDSLKK